MRIAAIYLKTLKSFQTPLHAAALDDKHQFVALLLQAGANLDSVDASGEKSLQLAMKNRSEECVRTITMEMGTLHSLSPCIGIQWHLTSPIDENRYNRDSLL